MKTLNNVIDSSEVESRIPKGPEFRRIWDAFVGLYEGDQIMWFDLDDSQSGNFKSLPTEIKEILKELMKDSPYKNHFGVYLDW